MYPMRQPAKPYAFDSEYIEIVWPDGAGRTSPATHDAPTRR